jgi:hypothetical protein
VLEGGLDGWGVNPSNSSGSTPITLLSSGEGGRTEHCLTALLLQNPYKVNRARTDPLESMIQGRCESRPGNYKWLQRGAKTPPHLWRSSRLRACSGCSSHAQ